jgi:hypothetical protein
MNLPLSGQSAAKKKDIRFMAAKEERRGAVNPRSPGGAEASTARCTVPRGAARAGLTEGAERSLGFARKRMSESLFWGNR